MSRSPGETPRGNHVVRVTLLPISLLTPVQGDGIGVFDAGNLEIYQVIRVIVANVDIQVVWMCLLVGFPVRHRPEECVVLMEVLVHMVGQFWHCWDRIIRSTIKVCHSLV